MKHLPIIRHHFSFNLQEIRLSDHFPDNEVADDEVVDDPSIGDHIQSEPSASVTEDSEATGNLTTTPSPPSSRSKGPKLKEIDIGNKMLENFLFH